MREYRRPSKNINDYRPVIPLSLNWRTFGYLIYVVLLYVLSIFVWSQNRTEEFAIYNYSVNLDMAKLTVSIILSMITWYILVQKYSELDSFSTQVMQLIILLYFMPGLVLFGVLGFEWTYLIEYFIYFLVMIFADRLMRYPEKPFFTFEKKSLWIVQKVFIIVSLLTPVFLAVYFRNSFSLSSILLTLNDPYGTRIAAREANTRWLILAIEYWGAYFSCFMISYSLRYKRYALAVVYVLCELFYFTLQGNRIFIFYIGIAIIVGLFKINKKIFTTALVCLLAMQIIEYFIFPESSIGLVTNVYRRFCVVPNIISTNYFDFFRTHTPDWLTGTFSGLFGIFGIQSNYGSNVGYLIGTTYYGWKMNANNGMLGGALFEFGVLGTFIDSIMFVLVLRLVDKLFFKLDKELKFIAALVYAANAVNLTTIWVQLFRPTPMLLFVLSCMVFYQDSSSEIIAE